MSACPVCNARGDRPCTECDVALAQYHAARVRAEASERVGDYAAEAVRLRAAQKGSGR